MTHIPLDAERSEAVGIARRAGDIMRQYFDGGQEITIKDDGTPLTIADTLINHMTVEQLQAVFPDDRIIGEEESVGDYGMGRVWFCDPIDGTKAFTWGVPTSMFSLGLVIDGVPQIGVAYDPFLDRMYTATRGHGAFCNDQPIYVNELNTLSGGIVAITNSPKEIIDYPTLARLLIERQSQLAIYSGAVHKATLVARGRLTGYIETKVNAYDMAAVHVIVEEAGGAVTSLDGSRLDYSRPLKGAMVSNRRCHTQLLEIIDYASSTRKNQQFARGLFRGLAGSLSRKNGRHF